MRAGEIEETVIPRNPLDVLAQHVVAICADEEIAVDELHELVRGAYPFADLSRVQLENVLDMLAGRYPSDEFAELRPRIVWDRTAGVVRGRAGARRLAVTNAGTIPDRGLYTVQLVDGGSRVGELDEEMVYEARAGQTFLLGASTWRIEEITRDRVLVSPAPGVPGAVPFWKGEGVGRPVELGAAIGAASRELVALSQAKALERLRDDYSLDELAARNLLGFLREQEAATGAVPSDRTVVVERFRDEIGDWRVCILTPFGGRVHAPWALALAARLRESLGLEVQSIWSDDGIALHLPDADAAPALAELLIAAEDVEELVVQEVGQSALFGSRFRENAARALLIPRNRPGERTPLWQQRLKAQALLQVARRYPAFPIVLETYRECLQDVFDLPGLRELLGASRPGRSTSSRSRRRRRRPSRRRCSSTTSRRTCTRTTRRRRSGGRRRCRSTGSCCGSCSARRSCASCSIRAPSPTSRRQLRGEPRTSDDLHHLLLLRGHLRSGEYAQYLAEPLLADRRAIRVRIGDDEVLVAAEDAGRYRDALGAMPPSGLPDAFLESGELPLRTLLARFARGRGPFTTAEAALRFGIEPALAEPELEALEREERLVRGELRPGGTEREWCDPDVLRRLRRASLAALRKEVEPVEQTAYARFLPSWHGIGRRTTLREALVPLQASPCRWRCGRARCCPAAYRTTGRSSSTSFARPERSCGWEPGSTASRSTSARTQGFSARLPAPQEALVRQPTRSWPLSPLAPCFGLTSSKRHELEGSEALAALWELVWAGEVTNDAWQPLRAPRRYGVPKPERRPRRFSRRRAAAITATQGRWSPTERLFAGPPDRRALAELLLERQGIVTRDGVRAEGIAGGYGAVYGELRALETLGLCRRGYFVEGLGGAQFALGGAVERVRELRPREDEEPEALVLAAADPAQPYGAALPWPKRAGARAARVAGAYVVLLGGVAVLFVERERPLARAAARRRCRVATPCARRARPARARHARPPPLGRALRRRGCRRVGGHAAARRGGLRSRAAARRAPPVMRRGSSSRTSGRTPIRVTVADLAALAEGAGWEALLIWDHLGFVWGPPAGDPWIALAAASSRTSQLVLGTDITPLPRRRPHVLAHQVATLDALSGGRVVFGVGIGGAARFGAFGEEERSNAGRDARRRARGRLAAVGRRGGASSRPALHRGRRAAPAGTDERQDPDLDRGQQPSRPPSGGALRRAGGGHRSNSRR